MKTHGLEAKIIEKHLDKTILEINKQKITVSSRNVPHNASEGEILEVLLFNPEEGITQDKKLAKTILEEILNGQ